MGFIMSKTHLTVAMGEETQDRLQEIADKSGASKAKVIESLLLLDDQAILNQIEHAKETIAKRKRERLDRKKEIVGELSKLTPEQLDALMVKVKAEKNTS